MVYICAAVIVVVPLCVVGWLAVDCLCQIAFQLKRQADSLYRAADSIERIQRGR